MSSRKKQSSKYIGVHPTSNGQFQAKLIFKGQHNTFGPFATEEEAARQYDKEVLKRDPNRTILNFPNKEQASINVSKRLKNLRKKINKTHGHKELSKKQKEKDRYIREQFPMVMRNKICANQGWKCNFCQEVLSDKIIIDHMIPLFLGGSNGTFNLQAICPSCDRFKTSYLDHKILKTMNQTQPLTVKDVIRVQKEHFCMMSCIDPNENDSKEVRPTKRQKRSNSDDESYCPSDDSDSEAPKDEPAQNNEEINDMNLDLRLSASASEEIISSDEKKRPSRNANKMKKLPMESGIIEEPIRKINREVILEEPIRKINREVILEEPIRKINREVILEEPIRKINREVIKEIGQESSLLAPISITVGKTLIQISHLN